MVRDHRGTHTRPEPGSKDHDFGLRQREVNIERYHYLRAFLEGKFVVNSKSVFGHADNRTRAFAWIDPESGDLRLNPSEYDSGRRDVIFASYTRYALQPFEDIKIHPRDENGIHPGDLEVYTDCFKSSWKVAQGGILYAIGDERSFSNCMIHYFSLSGTSGNPEWDDLFSQLKERDFPEQIIPCMVRLH